MEEAVRLILREAVEQDLHLVVEMRIVMLAMISMPLQYQSPYRDACNAIKRRADCSERGYFR